MKGFWNGEPCDFVPVEYTVTQTEPDTWWNNRFVGQRRQALQITYKNETWLIDNQHGDGYHKVIIGMGSPRCGHKSVSNPADVKEIEISKMKVIVDSEAIKKENQICDDYIKNSDPALWEKLVSLQKMIQNK